MNGKDKATPVPENVYRMLYLQASWRVTDTNSIFSIFQLKTVYFIRNTTDPLTGVQK